MSNVDTSSYPKAGFPQPKSLIETAQGFQQLEANKLAIDKSRLELINRNYEFLIRELNSLPPDASGDDMLKFGRNAVKQKLVTPEMFAEFATSIPRDPAKMKQFRDSLASRMMSNQEAVNFQYGVPGVYQGAQSDTPVAVTPRTGGMRPTQPPIQRQLGPETTVPTPEGDQRLGPQVPQLPSGAVPAPGGLPGQYTAPNASRAIPTGPINNPAIPGPSSNFGGNVLGATVEAPTPNQVVQNRGMVPAGPMASQPPMFEEGKKMLVADQQEAAQRAMRIKPLAQAIGLMQQPGMLSGPLSEQFTQGVAALKTFGLIDQAANDPTAIRQEVAKKLAQYVQGNPVGQRSDSAQILAEASSPNPKAQTLQALFKLSKDAIALDRIQIAMPNAFKDKDLSKYPSSKSVFPQSVDERAFALDFEKDNGQKIVDGMAKKLGGTAKEKAEAEKFFKSLRIAKENGFY